MTGNRSLYLFVSQIETSRIQIPRTPVGICMRMAFNEVYKVSSCIKWSDVSTYETETLGDDTSKSTDTA
jgi:hypothetical protein